MTEERKKILVIEDETALLYALQARLSLEGYEIITATTAEEAIKVLKKKQPDLVILDIILPKMDGFGFLRKIKEDPKIKAVPVIIVSNVSERKSIEKGIKLGAKDYLPKAEYNLEEIINKIKKLV